MRNGYVGLKHLDDLLSCCSRLRVPSAHHHHIGIGIGIISILIIMPKALDEDQLRRKQALQEKRAARRIAKEQEELEAAAAAAAAAATQVAEDSTGCTPNQQQALSEEEQFTNKKKDAPCYIVTLPEDAIYNLFSMLCAADLGRLIATCTSLNQLLSEARPSYLLSRLGGCPTNRDDTTSTLSSVYTNRIRMLETPAQAYALLQDSYSGGNTGRLLTTTHSAASSSSRSTKPKNKNNKNATNASSSTLLQHPEFVSFARFLEQAVCGYAHLVIPSSPNTNNNTREYIKLPKFTQGRFVSVSPEHSLIRLGLGESSSSSSNQPPKQTLAASRHSTKQQQQQDQSTQQPPPLSGVASWGVGKRGQLGHGKRQDERHPQRIRSLSNAMMFNDGLLNKIRIVQVSAGGGLVRVAHSLLLTDTGRVLSFGTGQYGALGHGYNAAKQLPDVLSPKYIDALANGVGRIINVSAGELHSAAVTVDGDVYTWGDGFCGQLGHGDKRPRLLPKQVEHGGLQDECIASVTCGSRHTLVVTEDTGEVWSFGLGHFGVLGRSFTPFDYDADTAVEAFTGAANAGGVDGEGQANGVPVAAAAAAAAAAEVDHGNGAASSASAINGREGALDADLMAHLDLINNLTLDDSSTQCIPMPVESLKGIRMVGTSAGHRHSLFLDAHGGLYSSGAGITGCLGHGDTVSQMYPVKIMSLQDEGVAILQMSAGVDMSMAVSTTGDVYAWGKTVGGRIGLDPISTRGIVMQPRRVSLTRPKDDNSTDISGTDSGVNVGQQQQQQQRRQPIKAVDVECGYVHSIIVALDGTLHICGSVGIEGEADGQFMQQEEQQQTGHGEEGKMENDEEQEQKRYKPRLIPDINIWHRLPEPSDPDKPKVVERWKKFGKYEVKGRSKMLSDPNS
jgi:alpha-tubulin suppressor-like RCC1 family protein